jgi:hypothetical protein
LAGGFVHPHLSSIIPDTSTIALWQKLAEKFGSKAEKTWQKVAVNFSYKVSLFILVGFFNMP